MIILDKPYISEELKAYLDASKVPVLHNSVAEEANMGHCFNLLPEEEFAARCNNCSGLYTLSENSLEWVSQHIQDNTLLDCIRRMKDKYAFRETLRSIYPDFFFQKVKVQELRGVSSAALPFPIILKPAVGFFSLGVYTITNEEDWEAAISDIERNRESWKEAFPESVVDGAEFILEQYISGAEFAIDAFFDEEGKAVILNILKHDFASLSDVSDRLYYTSKELILQYHKAFEAFLNEMNRFLGITNFPFHAELRVSEDGTMAPIEFNPLRFAGWCCTDLSYFAYGFQTYDYFLTGKQPDWETLLAGKDGLIYTLIVLDKPSCYTPDDQFDYDLLEKDFEKVLCLRRLNYKEGKPFGFLFTETRKDNQQELQRIMHSDLTEYLYRIL